VVYLTSNLPIIQLHARARSVTAVEAMGEMPVHPFLVVQSEESLATGNRRVMEEATVGEEVAGVGSTSSHKTLYLLVT